VLESVVQPLRELTLQLVPAAPLPMAMVKPKYFLLPQLPAA
jgi:hypothetical protein